MRKTIRFPAPQLSQLKEVNIDLCMTGRHYGTLATSDGELPESVVTSILNDLMEEDANQLTLSELRHLFMLVKIHSLENKLKFTVRCRCTDSNGNFCNEPHEVSAFLSDEDLNPTPEDYKVPEIVFRTEKTEKTYKIMPPTMNLECALYDYFQTVKNVQHDEIFKSHDTSFQYLYMRGILHLVDEKGERFFNENSTFDGLMNYLDCNPYNFINELFDKVEEVSQFGVQNKTYELKCKKCGGKVLYNIPLLAGVTY